MKNKKTVLCFLAVVLSMFMSVSAFAHGVLYKGLEGNRVQFIFDDDEPLSGAFIHVHNADGEVVAEGETNNWGVFDFSEIPDAFKIEAQDLFGHRSVYYVIEGVMASFVAYTGVVPVNDSDGDGGSAPAPSAPVPAPAPEPALSRDLVTVIISVSVAVTSVAFAAVVAMLTRKKKD